MIHSILAAFTFAAAMGQATPSLIEPFKTLEECRIAKAKMQHEQGAELNKQGVVLACLNINWSDT